MDNRPFVVIGEDILSGVQENYWTRTIKNMLAKKFPNGVTIGNRQVNINKQSRQELTFSKYTQWLRNNEPQIYADKYRSLNNSDEIILASRDYINKGLEHAKKTDKPTVL